ncbi:MAG: hypothetical protein ACLT8E_00525 [Akkermansia sp.]
MPELVSADQLSRYSVFHVLVQDKGAFSGNPASFHYLDLKGGLDGVFQVDGIFGDVQESGSRDGQFALRHVDGLGLGVADGLVRKGGRGKQNRRARVVAV